MPIPLGIFATAGAGGAGGSAFELISTQVLTSSASSVTFSSIPATYKHLQIRLVARGAGSFTGLTDVRVRLNGDSGSNYAWHYLAGNGSGVSSSATTASSFIQLTASVHNNDPANVFGTSVFDLLDYANTSKNTTLRALSGAVSNDKWVELSSGLWNNTAAVSSIEFTTIAANIRFGSRFSLYGIKG